MWDHLSGDVCNYNQHCHVLWTSNLEWSGEDGVVSNNIARASMSSKATSIEVVILVGVCSIGLAFLGVGEKLIIHQTQWPRFSVVIFGFRFTAVLSGTCCDHPFSFSVFVFASFNLSVTRYMPVCLSPPAGVCLCLRSFLFVFPLSFFLPVFLVSFTSCFLLSCLLLLLGCVFVCLVVVFFLLLL